jgi:FtsP/CotA-like multicopper oxidase with cupredoxin domain
MKEEKNTKPDEGQNEAPSRRDFMRNAVLGAGALAMLTSQSSCESPSSGGSGGASSKSKEPIKFEVPDGTPEYNPVIPQFNLSLQATLPKANPSELPPITLKATLNSEKKVVGTTTDKDGNETEYLMDDYFTYDGKIPGPTIKIPGDGTIHVNLWNQMPGNFGNFAYDQVSRYVKNDKRWYEASPDSTEAKADYLITEHLYGPHQQNTTNLHTHGLHVSPGLSREVPEKPSNIHSDNVLLRVIPEEDYYAKKKAGIMLMNNEQVAQATYAFKLGTHRGPHYPGTHWYHPHPHGATFDQVAGGMAGFIFVTGDVDEFLEKKYAQNEYEEFPLLIQRIFAPINTPDEFAKSANNSQGEKLSAKGDQKKVKKSLVHDMVNGVPVGYKPNDITGKIVKHFKTHQVIRFRVLNGSVDGQGYIRFFVTKSTNQPAAISNVYSSNPITGEQYLNKALKQWDANAKDKDNRVCLNNMAFDGVTLVNLEGDYYTMPVEWLTMSPANRADFLFTPTEAGTYTVWAQDMEEAVDSNNLNNLPGSNQSEINVRVATIIVKDGGLSPVSSDGVLDVDFNDSSVGVKVTVPEEIKPIGLEEITIKSNAEATNAYDVQGQGNSGKIRGRRVVYSGFGHASVVSSVLDNDNQTTENKDKLTNAMLIDGKKYGADTPETHGWDNAQHRMIVNTAEEWTLFNYSTSVYGVSGNALKEPTDSNCVSETYDGSLVYFGCPKYQVQEEQSGQKIKTLAKSVHHPFHIHQNPFLCMSIQDRNGNELLPTDENGVPIPRWQDVVYIPRNGGRVVFRSRFWDFTGKYVNHCHLLQHEDWGMMQAIEVLPNSTGANGKYGTANYIPMPVDDATRLDYFPGLNLHQMVGMGVGKVAQTLDPNGQGADLANLHYDPKDPAYFDQPEVTGVYEGVVSPTENFVMKYPLPNDTTPRKWNNEGLLKLMQKLNSAPPQSPGKLPDSYHNRKNNIVGKLL